MMLATAFSLRPPIVTHSQIRKIQVFNPCVEYKEFSRPLLRSTNNIHEAVGRIVDNELSDKQLPPQWPKSQNRYMTTPKDLIIEHVDLVIRQLANNEYLDKSGNASRLLFGEKGIGKSSALTLATMGTWITYPTVIPIYIEYTGASNLYQAPSEILAQSLGLPLDAGLTRCLKKLKEDNKFALIIADEIEHVYSSMEDRAKRLTILQEIAELGSQRTGRTYTYLCGSSSLVPALISKNAVHHEMLRREFPLVSEAPNLNGKKFSGFRIHRGLQVRKDFEILKNAYSLSDKTAHVLYFTCGTNLRTLDTMIGDLKSFIKRGCTTDDDLTKLIVSIRNSCHPSELWDQRASKTSISEHGKIIDSLLNKLVAKNYGLINYASKNNDNLFRINWITEIKPLTKEEVSSVCAEFGLDHIIVNDLVDKGYFSGPPHLEYLNVDKPSTLLYHFSTYQRQRWSWLPFANRMFQSYGKKGFDIIFAAAIEHLIKTLTENIC